jgi:hypothetical protein
MFLSFNNLLANLNSSRSGSRKQFVCVLELFFHTWKKNKITRRIHRPRHYLFQLILKILDVDLTSFAHNWCWRVERFQPLQRKSSKVKIRAGKLWILRRCVIRKKPIQLLHCAVLFEGFVFFLELFAKSLKYMVFNILRSNGEHNFLFVIAIINPKIIKELLEILRSL